MFPNRRTLLAGLALLLGGAAAHAQTIDPSLKALIDGPQRAEKNRVRDIYRHPAEALSFFGVKPDSVVVEILPGAGGYWTEILAPYLKAKGRYIAANFEAASTSDEAIKENAGFKAKVAADPTDYDRVKDLARYPELVFLNRFDMIVPIFLALATIAWGCAVRHFWPATGTSGAQMLVWGFFISTVLLLHGTLCINSLAHTFGRRRYDTEDESRNSLLLALITLGEGWHNNHHFCMTATRQGFYWWEIDITYYLLKLVSWTGAIWDLHPVPPKAYEAAARHQLRHQPASNPT